MELSPESQKKISIWEPPEGVEARIRTKTEARGQEGEDKNGGFYYYGATVN